MKLILPGNPLFDITLSTPPPDWRSVAERAGTHAFVADSQSGILRTVDGKGCQEYLLGGEYEERLDSFGYEFDFYSSELEGIEELYIDF